MRGVATSANVGGGVRHGVFGALPPDTLAAGVVSSCAFCTPQTQSSVVSPHCSKGLSRLNRWPAGVPFFRALCISHTLHLQLHNLHNILLADRLIVKAGILLVIRFSCYAESAGVSTTHHTQQEVG